MGDDSQRSRDPDITPENVPTDALGAHPRLVRIDPADRVVDLRALFERMQREEAARNVLPEPVVTPPIEAPVRAPAPAPSPTPPTPAPNVERRASVVGLVVAALVGATAGAFAVLAFVPRTEPPSREEVEVASAPNVEPHVAVPPSQETSAPVQGVTPEHGPVVRDAGARATGVEPEVASAARLTKVQGTDREQPRVTGEASPVPVVAEQPAETPARRPDDIDSLLDRAIGQAPAKRAEEAPPRAPPSDVTTEPAAPAPSDDGVPETPSRADITRVLGSLLAEIRRCAGEQVGLATATILVRSDGTVGSVSIGGDPFGGTGEGACMEEVVRGARFPAFKQTTFRITYPFSIR